MEVKTRVLEPNYFNQGKCEFLLPKDVLYSSFRLANLGATANVANNGTARFDGIIGVASLIKNMYLYNNNDLIAQVQNFNRYMFYRSLKRSNAQNYSLQRALKESSYGVEFARNRVLNFVLNENVIPQTPNAQVTGILHLMEIFPFLYENPILDSRMLNLKLVIEWNSLASEGGVIGGNIFYTNQTISNLNIYRPQLIVDLYEKEWEVKDQTWIYHDIVFDSVSVPLGQVNISRRLNNFNGMFVDDLYILNLPTTGSNFVGRNCSLSAQSETYQFQVNGENLLPYNGLGSSTEKTGLLTDLYGSHNIHYGGDFAGFTSTAVQTLVLGTGGSAIPLLTQHLLSPAGIKLGRLINELYVNYSKASSAVADINAASTLMAFAHVLKSKMVTKSGMIM